MEERRLRITHDGSVTTDGTKVVDATSGKSVHCARVKLNFEANEAVCAEFHLYGPEVDVLVDVASLSECIDSFVNYLVENWRPPNSEWPLRYALERAYLTDLAKAWRTVENL